MTTKTTFLNTEAEKAIRKAWRAGRKKITLDGRVYTITKKSRKVKFTSGGVPQSRTEHWLQLNRADGAQLPCGQIELTDKANLRSAV